MATSPPIGQALAFRADDRATGALRIPDPELYAVVMAEIEFSEIAMQMFLAHVLIGAINPAFQDREKVLGGVG